MKTHPCFSKIAGVSGQVSVATSDETSLILLFYHEVMMTLDGKVCVERTYLLGLRALRLHRNPAPPLQDSHQICLWSAFTAPRVWLGGRQGTAHRLCHPEFPKSCPFSSDNTVPTDLENSSPSVWENTLISALISPQLYPQDSLFLNLQRLNLL